MGVVTRPVPVGHPDFGKAFPCVCQRDRLASSQGSQLRAVSNLEMLADKTFATFQLDLPGLNDEQIANLRGAYERARRFADAPEGWLVFQGNYGSGKTHLAAAIANYRLEQGDRVYFITVPDLLDHLRSTYAPSSEVEYDELFDRIRNVPLLVLDDLGAESPTPWAQEKLYQLINHRYLHKLATLFTTNSELAQLDARIRSRLVDWHLAQSVNLRVPDFRRGDIAREQNPLTNLDLYGEMVFETFDLRQGTLNQDLQRNLRQAFDTAMAYAQAPKGWLLFLGDHGCGKTHLAAAIANYRHALGETVVVVTAPDLLDYLRAAFTPADGIPFDRRFYEIRNAPLLVIDQLDLTNASPWAREKLRQIADHRYLAHLPTVFTSTQQLEEIDPLLRSRLSDTRHCQVFAIRVPDYRGGLFDSSRRAPSPRK